MRAPVQRKKCGHCGQLLLLREGRGRRRDYCDELCRRRAQRARNAQRGQPPSVPSAARSARHLAALTGRLMASQRLQLPLRAQLEIIDSVYRQAERCTAAVVHEAQQAGVSWEEVGAAAGITAAQASARWSTPALRALFPPRQAADRRGAVQRLADALACLQISSGVVVDEAAERAGLQPDYVLQALNGDAVLSWPEVYTLAGVFGGTAEDLRLLWESAAGTLMTSRLPAQGAVGCLAAALRGLHLSAGSPHLNRLGEQVLLPVECLRQVLAGRHALPWPATARLVRALGGRIDDIEPLWQAVRQAAESLHGSCPAESSCNRCRAQTVPESD